MPDSIQKNQPEVRLASAPLSFKCFESTCFESTCFESTCFESTCFESLDPNTGEVLAVYPIMPATQVTATVAELRERGVAWARTPLAERASKIRQLRDSIAADSDSLAMQVATEIGKPLQEALSADLMTLVQGLDWLSHNMCDLLAPRRIPGESRARLEANPYGAVGVIGTWNYPLLLDGFSIAWALAAGNAVVWKPSELATGCALALLPHFERAGVPVGMVTGNGEVGQALCNAPVDKLAFTGGVTTGRKILAQLAQHGTPAVMELSGNDAMILRDGDARSIEAAAKAAVWARVCNAGQSCVSPQRIFALGETCGPFLHHCRQILTSLRAGQDYGPLRTEELRGRAHTLVQEAISAGAELLVGGGYADASLLESRLANGFYYLPTLLTGVGPEMAIQREDFFGPILCVQAVSDEEEAISLANATPMGLGASIWTQDMRAGQEIASRLRAGVVTINMETLLMGTHPALPFGGMGASGFGRQRGAAGLEEFVQWKTLHWQNSAGAQRHLFPYREPTLPILRGLIAWKSARGFRAKMRAAWQCFDAARNWK